MATALDNIGAFVGDVGKGFMSGLQTTPRAQTRQTNEFNLDSKKIERLLKIAQDPGFSRPLRVNALNTLGTLPAWQSILNSGNTQIGPNWAEETIASMDKQYEETNALRKAQASYYTARAEGSGTGNISTELRRWQQIRRDAELAGNDVLTEQADAQIEALTQASGLPSSQAMEAEKLGQSLDKDVAQNRTYLRSKTPSMPNNSVSPAPTGNTMPSQGWAGPELTSPSRAESAAKTWMAPEGGPTVKPGKFKPNKLVNFQAASVGMQPAATAALSGIADQWISGQPSVPQAPKELPGRQSVTPQMPQPKNKAEYDALPVGTKYMDPNGQLRTKPAR